MKAFFFFFLTLGLLACNNSNETVTAAVTGPAGDFSAYEVSQVSGSPFQKASKSTEDGTLSEEGFIWQGQKAGTWISYYPDGKMKSSTQYLSGIKNGVHLEFNDRCQITVHSNYVNDQLHGRHTTYKHGSRREVEAHYTNGILDGVYRTFDKLGKVQREIHYRDGELHGPNIFYNDGEKTMEYEYKNGEKVSGGIIEG